MTDTGFDTNNFFVGGAGMFMQYFDIVKPVYLYAVFSIILSENHYGLPVDIIKDMNIGSLVEWYKNRRYKNPLQQLDWAKKAPAGVLDDILNEVLQDPGVYKLAPLLAIDGLLYVYKSQRLSFPFYIYSEEENKNIRDDCDRIFAGTKYKYVYGDLKPIIENCGQNFTYIFSDVELMRKVLKVLHGTYSHVLLADDYRYNYLDAKITFKYDLAKLMSATPFIRLGTTTVFNIEAMPHAFENIIDKEV